MKLQILVGSVQKHQGKFQFGCQVVKKKIEADIQAQIFMITADYQLSFLSRTSELKMTVLLE